jgi:DNA-binding MarR family transcriptional regulator
MKARREILTEIILSTFRVNSLLLEKGDELVAPLDLTSARWQVLGAIEMAEHPLSCPQIARTMGITRQGAQKQLDLALKEGLVATAPNPRHERSPLYQLTTSGKSRIAKATQLQSAWANALSKGITGAELNTTLEVLHSLEARLVQADIPVME